MSVKAAEQVCDELDYLPPYKNDFCTIEPADDDYEAFCTFRWDGTQENFPLRDFLTIAGSGMNNSNHPWTQFNVKCYMDDKGVSLWDNIGEHGYRNSVGYYNAKTLGIFSHDKLARIKEICEEL